MLSRLLIGIVFPLVALGFIRPARADDTGDIARIQLATWRTGYRRILPTRVLDQLDEGWLTERWLTAVVDPPTPRHRVLVAIEQGESLNIIQNSAPTAGYSSAGGNFDLRSPHLVGFGAGGPADAAALAPDEDPLPDSVAAVTELLVEPRWSRRGHGSRLLSAVVDGWRTDGFTHAVAWIYRDDTVMRAFLESAGWAPDGATRALDVDDQLIDQLRFHTQL